MQATMSKADQRKLQKLKLKASRRDQYKRFTRSKGGNFFYTLFLILFGLLLILYTKKGNHLHRRSGYADERRKL